MKERIVQLTHEENTETYRVHGLTHEGSRAHAFKWDEEEMAYRVERDVQILEKLARKYREVCAV